VSTPSTAPNAPATSQDVYRLRRERICAALRSAGDALVLHGGKLQTRANDTEYRFRPDSDFHYLTGLSEPGAILVLRAGRTAAEDSFVLFVRKRDRDAEVWSGRRIGPEGAKSHYQADEAFPLSALATELPKLLDGVRAVHLPLGRYGDLDRKILTANKILRRKNREGRRPPIGLFDSAELLGEERIVKDDAALASLRHAVALSAHAHREAMLNTRPGQFEYEVEARLEYEFRKAGSSGPGYGSIVGGGDNATILHYVDNCDRLEDGSILLIDAGAEWDYFSGDITRSWPVNGKFTAAQRDVYEIVLAANRLGIEMSRVGENINGIHDACLRRLCEGLKELHLIDKGESLDAIIEQELYKPWYMHRTSHWLGVDVHDAGDYCREGTPRPLAPNYVLTIEPALYIPADDEVAAPELRGIGIRVEDDVRVTDDLPEVLSATCPKTVEELEAIIGSAAS
jgi:Xaa-Pro aminopeptidase